MNNENRVKIFDMSRRIEKYRKEIDLAIQSVIQSSNFILGKKVAEFETHFAAYVGAKYCTGVANGTDALELSLIALNLPKGSSVLTIANAGNYSSTAILAVGLIPHYIDVDAATLNTSLDIIERTYSENIKCVIVTHLYGNPVLDIQEIADFCKKNNIALIEDCAQAHGASVSGRKVGSFGDMGTFSHYPTKNLGGLGDGGSVTTNSAILKERLDKLRNYGWSEKYLIDLKDGRNSRLDEIQASVLCNLLPTLDESNAIRSKIAAKYYSDIQNPSISFPKSSPGSVHHLFVILTDYREQLQNHLDRQNIENTIHYPVIDSNQIMRGGLLTDNLENTHWTSRRILTIPCNPEMTENEICRTIEALNSFSA